MPVAFPCPLRRCTVRFGPPWLPPPGPFHSLWRRSRLISVGPKAFLRVTIPACLLLGVQTAARCQEPWWAEPLQPTQLSLALRLLLALSVLSLAPALLIMVTSFTRVVVVLSLVRSALSTQQTPPNFVIVSLALFLTFFIMYPVGVKINEAAIQPYMQGSISYTEALQRALGPLRDFMLRQTREEDLSLFLRLAGSQAPLAPDDIPAQVLLPSFMISELRTAFEMAFVLYIPFVVIDLLVSTVLMSMGMLMLPPVMISLPIKLLLFVLVDGWHLLAETLVTSFR